MFEALKGGFSIKPQDAETLARQRALTKRINDDFIQVGAVFLKTSSKNPYDDDWFNKGFHDTDLQAWIDDPEAQLYNVGFNLQFGWVDLDIDTEDPDYNRCLISAMEHVGLDTRFRFGRQSFKCATHVLVQLGEDEATNFAEMTKFEPGDFKLKGKRYKTQIRSMPVSLKPSLKEAKQTVMPGSIYTSKVDSNTYDLSVWYGSTGVANKIQDIAATTPRRTEFEKIVTAIAFGTMTYLLGPHWVEGSRQMTAYKVAGWLARMVAQSYSMNNNDMTSDDVMCPVDSDSVAESLLSFICKYYGDTETRMRIRTYHDACEKLKRNPDAKIPGWPAIEALLGGEGAQALRTTFMPGSDVSILTQMAERYVYDETDDRYIDRNRFGTDKRYVHESGELDRRHKGDRVRIGGKLREAFKIFESSDMRRRIGARDLYPDLPPGGIYRISGFGRLIPDEADLDPSELTIFNTWKGWPVKLPDKLDDKILAECEEMFNQLLHYLARGNLEQMVWLKKWIAWTIQHPGEKQQIAPVIVGGQGVGKSFLGNIFMQSLMRSLWGTAAPKMLEGAFSVEPFINKMFVFIDEAKFHGDASTDEIKKLIRNVEIGGAEKYISARTYRIFSRVMFASNRIDMNIGQTNVQDRALFYMKAYDANYMKVSSAEFLKWTEGLKPWFDKFAKMLERMEVLEHYMYYFTEMEVNRHELESITHSSSMDADIISANMGWPRRIAKYIIEDGRIYDDLDITYPFSQPDFHKRVVDTCKELGFNAVAPQRVQSELTDAGILVKYVENGRNYWRFKYKIGTLTQIFGDHILMPLESRFQFTDADFGDNTTTLTDMVQWKGLEGKYRAKF